MSGFGEIFFKNLGRSSVSLKPYRIGENIFVEKPACRSFPPEKELIELCDEHEIDRMFGCFLVGYAFTLEKYQKWIYDVMYAPDPSTLNRYENFADTLKSFAPHINQYTAKRFGSHPPHWDKFIQREPKPFTEDDLIRLWLVWNTNAHSYNAYFEQNPRSGEANTDNEKQGQYPRKYPDFDYEEIPFDEGGDLGTGIFEVASRVPHSCAPNMSYTVTKFGVPSLRYRCVRPVTDSVLLSFSYIETYDLMFRPTAQRRADLGRHKYFFCMCPRCRMEDTPRTLPCPKDHKCPHCPPNQRSYCVKADIEGWEHVKAHPEMFRSSAADRTTFHPKPSKSLFDETVEEEEIEILPPTATDDIPQPVSFQSLCPELDGVPTAPLYWGSELDTHFDLSPCFSKDEEGNEVVKPWRCLLCSERFTEEQMKGNLYRERTLSRWALKVLGKDDYLSDKDDSESADPNGDEEDDRTTGQKIAKYRKMFAVLHECNTFLGPYHWTSGWLNERMMEHVGENMHNKEYILSLTNGLTSSPTSLLLRHGYNLIAYANHVTNHGLTYSSGPCYFLVRLAFLLEAVERTHREQDEANQASLDLECERWSRPLLPVPEGKEKYCYTAFTPPSTFPNARDEAKRIFKMCLVPFVSEWGEDESMSRYLMKTLEGQEEEGKEMLKLADAVLEEEQTMK
ncbi:hypothetical protein BLNAU_18700 [Blattamonas nauphoetae]|uniref:SET domain-containing protein n=1 Tax=Blattamonas nauphoetae TaxID=2049346 RepID=A0ABQ9X3J4_9EUKA|nr:hypothetical protein BLNAU_18700 [Blattamonas nauphoetae]